MHLHNKFKIQKGISASQQTGFAQQRKVSNIDEAKKGTDHLANAIHAPNSIVDTSHYPHSISIRNEGDHISDIAILAPSTRNQQPVLKTGYQAKNKKIQSIVAPWGDAQTPHRLPQEQVLNSTAAARISDFQGADTNILSKKNDSVNDPQNQIITEPVLTSFLEIQKLENKISKMKKITNSIYKSRNPIRGFELFLIF